VVDGIGGAKDRGAPGNPVRHTLAMATKIILDVDTGTDDAVALMTAALSPDIDLVGATVVNGNTVLESCVENTLRVFEWIGLPDVPVHAGMSRPLARAQMTQRNPATQIHGDKLDLPPATIAAGDQHAVDWLIDTYLASDGDITLVPVGPLTNIATAIQKEPRILEKIPEIVIMGGAHDHGNATPSAEFNIWLDPEAARIVVNCGRPIRMVPLDATHRALVSLEDAERLRGLGTPAGEAAYRFVAKRIEGYDATQPMHRAGAAPVHDALAVCAVIDPSVISTHLIPVDVEVWAELSVGRTVCDFRFRGGKPANVRFAMDADEPKFVRMLTSILGRTAG
jgi:inosine-uridine nucleoside N-ribohydrolase